jgi:SPP1 family phage portal protein
MADFVGNSDAQRNLFGRRMILSDCVENELNEEVISKILTDKFSIHEQNVEEYNYLYNYYKGKQTILGKTKTVRENINHKVLENNAYYMVEFKKGYVFGEPIQYVQRGDSANDEILTLNSYMLAEDKQTKDSDVAEWLYISGVAPRMVIAEEDNEDSPFSLYNLDPRQSFVVYNNGLGNKPLFGVTYFVTDDGKKVGSVYTKDKVYKIVGDSAKFEVEFENNHILNNIPILEYTLNKSRLGIIEIVLSLLDTLNQIDSNDMDAIDQFVQSLVVFVNNDVDAETFKELMELGAVKVKTENPSTPADVKLLTNDLSHADTKVYYDRIYNQMLTIVGIPSKNDKASGGDTGQARLLGEGWTMADERAKQDENAFKRTAREELRLVLDICKRSTASGISKLSLKDIDIKFTRNKTDNMLVKAQSLLNLKQAEIAPDIAMTVCGLFSDPNETYYKSQAYYGEENLWKDNKNKETKPLIEEGK